MIKMYLRNLSYDWEIVEIKNLVNSKGRRTLKASINNRTNEQTKENN